MAKHINKELPELVEQKVISAETAEKIKQYYSTQKTTGQNRLFLVFGILGAILTGLGIILIVAHNWDDLSRLTKTIIAFLPMLIGQIACGFALLKKPNSNAWKESASVFLFFSVGASISLISQIYNIPGDLSSFLLTWMLLCFPLIYLMKSSVTALLYIIGITGYAAEAGYGDSSESHYYWLLLLLVLPHYYLLIKEAPKSNFTTFHNWILPLSLVAALGTIARNHGTLMFIAYMSLLGLLYLIGSLPFFQGQKLRNNGYLIIGALGTIGLLLALSFNWFWEDLPKHDFGQVFSSPEFSTCLILTLLASGLLIWQRRKQLWLSVKPIEPVFLIFIGTFIVGFYSTTWSVVLINILIFCIALLTIRTGAQKDHLGILNYGLLVIMALVVCRFFDTDISFVVRGLLFVLVGLGFFLVNYFMLKKRKAHDS